jgi:hypothetical protein
VLQKVRNAIVFLIFISRTCRYHYKNGYSLSTGHRYRNEAEPILKCFSFEIACDLRHVGLRITRPNLSVYIKLIISLFSIIVGTWETIMVKVTYSELPASEYIPYIKQGFNKVTTYQILLAICAYAKTEAKVSVQDMIDFLAISLDECERKSSGDCMKHHHTLVMKCMYSPKTKPCLPVYFGQDSKPYLVIGEKREEAKKTLERKVVSLFARISLSTLVVNFDNLISRRSDQHN